MKKLLIAIALSFIASQVHAVDPTAKPIGGQILLSLLSHVTAVAEQTEHGDTKLQFLDSVVQFGHFKNDYIFALDAGVSNSLAPDAQGKLSGTYGIHFHAISGVVDMFNLAPSLKETLKLLELNPRYSYDEDVDDFVFGVTFGARIPFN